MTKHQNTNSEVAKQKKEINLADYCPDLSYEEVRSFDHALHDYLDICMEIYWQKVADGSFPWPEDGTEMDEEDSTL